MNKQDLAGFIDHTLLKPDTTSEQVVALCAEAKSAQFCSVCILPVYVALAAQELHESAVKVCTVIGFPLGANDTQVKAVETSIAIEQGTDEVDMVLNIGALKAAQLEQVQADMAAVVAAAQGKTVKVILETCLLNKDEKISACELAVRARVDFVKTSTGFSHGGATVDDVRLMRATVGPDIGVKASGGVRDYAAACAMVEAGANRLGTSSGLSIIGAGVDANGDGY